MGCWEGVEWCGELRYYKCILGLLYTAHVVQFAMSCHLRNLSKVKETKKTFHKISDDLNT